MHITAHRHWSIQQKIEKTSSQRKRSSTCLTTCARQPPASTAWLLRLSAPVFAAPIGHLFNKSLAAGIVPTPWKTAIISLIPKVANPQQPSDFRPISVTPVLSRMLERLVVRRHIRLSCIHHLDYALPTSMLPAQQPPLLLLYCILFAACSMKTYIWCLCFGFFQSIWHYSSINTRGQDVKFTSAW